MFSTNYSAVVETNAEQVRDQPLPVLDHLLQRLQDEGRQRQAGKHRHAPSAVPVRGDVAHRSVQVGPVSDVVGPN